MFDDNDHLFEKDRITLNNDKVNAYARKLWESSQQSKVRSMSDTNIPYCLTKKQLAFISHSTTLFLMLYSEIYLAHEKQNSWELVQKVTDIIQRHFTLKRNDFILGSNGVETAGFIRGLVAIWFLSKDEKKKFAAEEIKAACEKMKPLIDFFGHPDKASRILLAFVVQMALRFQNAIELLALNERGVLNLADFITHAIVEGVLGDARKSYIDQSAESRVKFLIKLVMSRDVNIELLKSWKEKTLLTANSEATIPWKIKHLLYKSLVETPTGFFAFNGKNHEKGIIFPAQICSDQNFEGNKLYTVSQKF